MKEIDRFLSLFSQQVTLSLNILESIPDNLWRSIPADSDTNFLGERIKKISIEALIGHLMRAEDYWTSALGNLEEGGSIPPPVGVKMLDLEAPGMDLINQYRKSLAVNLTKIRNLSPEALATRFNFIGRQYTVQGFLWAIYAHHSYHFGQVDLLLRQQSYLPPEFLELPETQKLIG